MKKMKLSLDALRVESFTVDAEKGGGTVQGLEAPTAPGQLFSCNTCQVTCRTIACPCPVSEGVSNCYC